MKKSGSRDSCRYKTDFMHGSMKKCEKCQKKINFDESFERFQKAHHLWGQIFPASIEKNEL